MDINCKCGLGLNLLDLLCVEAPNDGTIELILVCHCNRSYSAFLLLDKDGFPLEMKEGE